MPLDRAKYYSRPSILAQYHENGLDRRLSGLVLSDGLMPMSQGWAAYRRFNPNAPMTTVIDDDGRGWQLTETQVRVFRLAQSMIDVSYPTMRAMALELGVAASTVSRAMWKLQAIGLLAFVIGRGRYAGMVILSRVRGDGLERFRLAAKARIRGWQKAAQRRFYARFSMLRPETSLEGVVSVQGSTTVGATLTAQRPWTVQELREGGII